MSTATVFHVIAESLAQDFDEFFREYYPLVYRTAVSVTGSHEDAEDVVQTIFMRLFRRGLPSRFSDNPKGYLYRAAVNASLTSIRSRRRLTLTGDEERFDAAKQIVGLDVQSPVQARLIEAIAQLNPRAVEMLILRYEHHYSDAEIAKLLGTSRGTIAVSLYRARRQLKKLLSASSAPGEEKP